MQEYKFLARHLRDLDGIAHQLIGICGPDRLVGFYGPMGAGKTTLIQVVCHALGVTGEVTSPTFALVNEYPSVGGFPVFHFDFYRINEITEALDFGIDEYFAGGEWCLMEWPEKIEDLLPPGHVKVFITVRSDSARLIRVEVSTE